MTGAGVLVPYRSPADHCEAETSLGDKCRNPAKFVMRCRNSGFDYDVCATHRRTGTDNGDALVGEIHRCSSCKGYGWLIEKEDDG